MADKLKLACGEAVTQRTVNAPTAGSNPAEPAKLKRGRPTITGPRPWDSEGMSRRTWYRRKKDAERPATSPELDRALDALLPEGYRRQAEKREGGE